MDSIYRSCILVQCHTKRVPAWIVAPPVSPHSLRIHAWIPVPIPIWRDVAETRIYTSDKVLRLSSVFVLYSIKVSTRPNPVVAQKLHDQVWSARLATVPHSNISHLQSLNSFHILKSAAVSCECFDSTGEVIWAFSVELQDVSRRRGRSWQQSTFTQKSKIFAGHFHKLRTEENIKGRGICL